MKNEKAREIRIWIREQGYSFYLVVALLLFLIIKSFFDLGENLQCLGYEERDFLPNKMAFILLVLWVFQASIFYKKTTIITSSALFLLLFCFLLAAFFLAAYAWIWIVMFRDFFTGLHPLHIPSLNEYDIFLHWVGSEVWRLNFPWGGIVFPLLVLIFYMPFIFYLVFHLEMKNKASLLLFSCLSLGMSLLLLSALMESLMIIDEGVGYQEVSGLDPFGHFLIERFHLKPVTPSISLL